MHRSIVARALRLAGRLACGPALAVPSCDLNGPQVNPDNGNTTRGGAGPMRCSDGAGEGDDVFEDGSGKAFDR